MRKRAVLFMLAVLLLIPGAASATTIAYINSAMGGVITLGDKTFGDFNVIGDFGPGDVSVAYHYVNGVLYADFQGDFLSPKNGDATLDFNLYYSVQAPAGQLISMIDQSFNMSAGGNGGTATIGESVYQVGFGSGLVAHSSLSWVFPNLDPEDPPIELIQGDDLTIKVNGVPTPLPKIWVVKDISLDANEGGTIGATALHQSFHQVPEPGTMGLLGLGMIGIWLFRRRRS